MSDLMTNSFVIAISWDAIHKMIIANPFIVMIDPSEVKVITNVSCNPAVGTPLSCFALVVVNFSCSSQLIVAR